MSRSISRLASLTRALMKNQSTGLASALSQEASIKTTPCILTSIQAHQQHTAATDTPLTTTTDTDTTSAAVPSTSNLGQEKLPEGHINFAKRQMMMIFTCTVCNVRSAKAFSKQAYEQGVVIVECSGCKSKHLIADHMGWFGEKGTIENFANDQVIRKLADGTLELTPEDIAGVDHVQAATLDMKQQDDGSLVEENK